MDPRRPLARRARNTSLGALLSVCVGLLWGCAAWQRPGEPLGVPHRAGGVIVRCTSGAEVYVEDRGPEGGPVVLLVHGFASSRHVWDAMRAHLPAGTRTLAVDLPGFGASSRRPGDYSPDGLAAALSEVLDARRVRRVDVVAHSWGSAVALALALREPSRVRRLALIGAFVFDEQVPPFFRWARASGLGEALFVLFYKERPEERYPVAFAEPSRVSLAELEEVRVRHARPGTVRAALAAARAMNLRALEARFAEVKQKSLLVWGREDRVSLVRFGEMLASRLPAAHLRVMRGVGHFPPVERPHETARLVGEFLDRAPRARTRGLTAPRAHRHAGDSSRVEPAQAPSDAADVGRRR